MGPKTAKLTRWCQNEVNLCGSLDLALKGLILCCTGLVVEDEQLRALHRQWSSEKPDDPLEFVFDVIWR
jgi:hypothetical protein